MRNVQLIAVGMIAMSAVGCAGNQQFKAAVLANSDLSASTAAAIKNGTVAVGMTKAQVQAAWGEPTLKNDASYGSQWRWGYKRLATPLAEQHIVKFDHAGQVIEWIRPQ